MADLEIETVEVTASLSRTLQEGIRMIPAVKCGKQIMAGIYLSRSRLSSFIKKSIPISKY